MRRAARETRRSAPYLTADDAVALDLSVAPPLQLHGRTIDAAELPRDESLRTGLSIDIDWNQLRRSTKADGPFNLAVVVRCRSTRWSETQMVGERITGKEKSDFEHPLVIDRDCVQSTVNAEVMVSLAEANPDAPPETASERHHILARQGFKIRLERSGFEFPTRWMSFEDRYPDRALWYVHIEPDSWTSRFRDAVRVLLNRDVEKFYRILENSRGEYHTPAAILRAQIAYDTLDTIFAEYFRSDEADRSIDPDGSRFCDVIHRTMDDLFEKPVETVRTWFEEDRALARARLQNAMQLDDTLDI